MMPNLNLLPGAIIEMVAATSHTHCLTQADRYGLMAAILDESLSDEDRRCIDRMLRALLRGKIQIVNEFSTVA